MKTLVYLSIALFTMTAVGQSKYEQGMKKAFELWGQNKTGEASNVFERIAAVEKDNWLPAYYVAQVNIVNSFGEKDAALLKVQLDKGLDFLNRAKTLAEKENPYIKVLEAQYYTAWIAFDGRKYGMKYSGKVSSLYKEALNLAPDNPIVIFSKVEWEAGAAQYFGKPLAPYCNEVKRALTTSKNFKQEGAFYPKFQEERAQKFIDDNCN